MRKDPSPADQFHSSKIQPKRDPDAGASCSVKPAGQGDELTPDQATETTSPPVLTIDWDAYLPYLEDEGIPEDQKRELIRTLWAIMLSFVDLGFGLSPVQKVVQEACGSEADKTSKSDPDMLPCLQSAKMQELDRRIAAARGSLGEG